MKIENLLYKISEVKKICIYNIATTIMTMIILSFLNVNMILFGALIYLLALYLICFFSTNETLHKYNKKSGIFKMDKEQFIGFFKKGKQLKLFLLICLPISCIGWVFLLIQYNELVLYLSLLDILSSLYIGFFLIWSVKAMINSFITTIFLTRVIEYVCINELIEKISRD